MFRLKRFYKQSSTWQDLEFLRLTRSHPTVNNYLFHTKKITRTEQEYWFNNEYVNDREYLIWLVYNEKIESPIAYVQYHIDSLIHRRCSAGYVIAPEYAMVKGKYDKQIIKLMIKNIAGWKDELHRLQIKIFPEDVLRLNKLTDCGFEVDGIIRDYVFKDGVFRDVYNLSYIL